MSAGLKLYRVIEDAWCDGLRAWCEAAPEAVLGGAECWLVVASRGQARWIKSRALSERLTLFGIKFFDARALRRKLCTTLRVENRELGREALEFLLKLIAGDREEADCQAVARNASACLRAATDLAAAGWDEEELDVSRSIGRDVFRALRESHTWTPELDRLLIAKASSIPLRSCVVGWDAANFPELHLLAALAKCSERCELFFPQPCLAAENVQQLWIETVEVRLSTSKTMCDASGFESPHDALVSRLEGSDLDLALTQPCLLVGRDWPDEIPIVRDDVLEWLARSKASERVALIVPGRAASSVAITRALVEAGVALLDETGETVAAEPSILIQEQIVRYFLLGCDVEALAALIKLLNENCGDAWPWLDPERVHACLNDAFGTVQSRSARLLRCGFSQQRDEAWQQIARLIENLGRCDESRKWDEWRAWWEAMLATLGLATSGLEPLWSTCGVLFGPSEISAPAFLEFLQEILAGRQSRRPPEAAEPHARVVVTTIANARHQTWERLVFLDSNEGVWPIQPQENPFLDDRARAALNARAGKRGHLLTTGDQSALEQARFLDLLEHCTGDIVFASVAREAAREAYPNEWVLRCLIESGDGGAKAALARWRDAVEICAPDIVALPGEERAHLENVHARRCDAGVPFDEYLFNFHGSNFEAQAWSAGKLDEALTCPATFALREVFGAESQRKTSWTRGEGMVIGSLTHRWLARALGGSDELKPLPRENFPARLREQVEATRARLAECYAEENLTLPIWWETCLRKAAWVARQCLKPVTDLDGEWFYAMEKRSRETVTTDGGPLKLKGRFDLVLSDRATLEQARVTVIDFKTGKGAPPTFTTLANGSGFQFAAYFLMAKTAGAASVSVGVIRVGESKLGAFTDADDMALRTAMTPLAKLQRDLNFGRRGPLVAQWGKCETLPIATLSCETKVLAEKAELALSD
ncbi:MAG: hypothetical protein QOD99_1158 [Chthoniobacter sp.]|jgi:RecB family exonuclease|nr:hypothetical protein [Chthoniobacter sp.]